jgi:Na+-driven multidrug efflux pump
MMISMMVQALYNIVDSIYVAQISEDAITALTLAFPVQGLMIGFCVGTGVGINALLPRSLGEQHYDAVNKSATAFFWFGLAASVLNFRCLFRKILF